MMLVLLSPSKTLNVESAPVMGSPTQPVCLAESEKLITQLRTCNVSDVRQLMKISEKLAELNVARYAGFEVPFTTENAKQAVLMFKGDVYDGLDAEGFNAEDHAFAQDTIRILSGLYGLLRPLDLMQPYRLEMGIRLENPRGKNLYEFWGERITDVINDHADQTDASAIINLASNEYFKAVKPKLLKTLSFPYLPYNISALNILPVS